jgi:hypothetical protein
MDMILNIKMLAIYIDEKSVYDKLLSLLAFLSLVALLTLGFYWQSLPLPPVEAEGQAIEK